MHCQIVPENSACFDGRNVRRDTLPGDHIDMCKFPNQNAVGYQTTLGHLKRLVVAAADSGGMKEGPRSEAGDSSSMS